MMSDDDPRNGGGIEEYICKTELVLCNVPDNIISTICQHEKLQQAIKFRLFSGSKRSAYSVTPSDRRCKYNHRYSLRSG